MLFILKKKKKKKTSVTKKHSSRTHSAPNWKGEEESDGRLWKWGGPQFLKNFIYELLKDYFHMAASDV